LSANFSGIRVPTKVLTDKALTPTDKLIVTEIINLDSGEGCYAQNRFLSRSINLDKSAISRCINTLIKRDLVYHIDAKYNRSIRSRIGCNKDFFRNDDPLLFSWVDSGLWLKSDLKPIDKIFLIVIQTYSYDQDGCKFSNDELAGHCGVSVGAIKRVITRLNSKNLIHVEGVTINRVIKIRNEEQNEEQDLDAAKTKEHPENPNKDNLELGMDLQQLGSLTQQVPLETHHHSSNNTEIAVELSSLAQQLGSLAQQLGSLAQQNVDNLNNQLGSLTQQLGSEIHQLGSLTQRLGSLTHYNREDPKEDPLNDPLEDQLKNIKKIEASNTSDDAKKLNVVIDGESESFFVDPFSFCDDDLDEADITNEQDSNESDVNVKKPFDPYSVGSIIKYTYTGSNARLQYLYPGTSQAKQSMEELMAKSKAIDNTTPDMFNHEVDTTSQTAKSPTKVESKVVKPVQKKVRKFRDIDISLTPDEGDNIEAVKSYIESRIKSKRHLTQRAFDLALQKAIKSAEICSITVAEAFDITVDKGWQGVNPAYIQNHLANEKRAMEQAGQRSNTTVTTSGRTIMPHQFDAENYQSSTTNEIDALVNDLPMGGAVQ
jgi:DNA-binding MarR family transcriptional regulator